MSSTSLNYDSLDKYDSYEVLSEPPTWRKQSACRGLDTNMFFVNAGQTVKATNIKKQLCKKCVVRKSCLQYALDNKCKGIWGGTSEHERKKFGKKLLTK
jgi:hypothetical protein